MASKRRTLSFSERHQKLVDENYRKKLHVQALQEIEAQIRNQMVRNENDNRAEQKRFLRLLQDEQFELDMEEAIQKAEENKRLRKLQLEQEEKLATELAKLKHESLKDEKMRQQVRENRNIPLSLLETSKNKQKWTQPTLQELGMDSKFMVTKKEPRMKQLKNDIEVL